MTPIPLTQQVPRGNSPNAEYAVRPSVSSGPNSIEIPSRLYGKYLVRSKIGVGGMAEVFLAEAVDANGHAFSVALKMLNKGASEEAFANEVDLMGLLSHPNLMKLIEHGRAYGRLWIALEYCIGGDLRALMDVSKKEMKPISAETGIAVILETLKGLSYFHHATSRNGAALRLIHSDVNPANIFVNAAGEVKLGDFGVASSSLVDIGPGEGLTAGKLSYLSPEQTRGETLTNASDVWAVGVMLHELVVGWHPFQREGATEQQIMQLIRAPKLTIPDYVDKPLAQIVVKALAPELKNRFKTCGEMAGPLMAYALDANAYRASESGNGFSARLGW
jgi:eukaryotic-like serine/threonine-protein kinase